MPHIPINIELPDGSRFNGEVFQHGTKKTMRRMTHVVFAMMNGPEVPLEICLENLREIAKTKEEEAQPWIDKLQIALETNRFSRFKVNTPTSFDIEYPEKYNLCLLDCYQKGEINGYAPISEAKRTKYWLSRWDGSWIQDQFKEAVKCHKEGASYEKKLIGKRKKRLYETQEYLKKNSSKWIAVIARTNYKEISPIEVLQMVPPTNKDITAVNFYSDPYSAFKWLGTIDLDDPKCSVWEISPNKMFKKDLMKSKDVVTSNPELNKKQKNLSNKKDFLINLRIKNAEDKNPLGSLSEALTSAGVDFSVSSVKAIEP